MSLLKKILIGIAALLGILIIANIGLNIWIEKKLPSIINEENDSPYYITYKDIDVSLFSSSIVANGIVVVPKTSLTNTAAKAGFYANISSVQVNQFNAWNLIFSNKLGARSIRVIKPEVILYKTKEKVQKDRRQLHEEVVEPFTKIVLVSDIYLESGDFKVMDAANVKPVMRVSNINANLEGILITDEILERKIPFEFDKYAVSYDSLFYRPNAFYDIRTKNFSAKHDSISITDIEYIPRLSREAFVKAIPKEKDLYAIKAANLLIRDMKWGYRGKDFFFHTNAINLESVHANIYRPKMPPDDLSKKPLYNKLLREIPFDLKVDTLIVRNSILEYEEEKTFEKGAGLLSFRRFNMYVRNIASGFRKKKMEDVKIHIDCHFMNVSPMEVDWTLNILDKSDGFNIKGSILNFPANKLEPFTKPYMNISAEGMLDKVYFNFTGNDHISKGDFAIDYEDLKFTVYRKKDKEKKNKLLSAVVNLFVKKDTKEKVKNAEIEVERIHEKSFFNFLWRSIAEGLKKILI